MRGLLHPSPLRRTFQSNLTSLTNQVNRDEEVRKFGGATQRGIPRLSRLSMRPISVLHETPHVMVAGRSSSNGFASNQFLVIHKQSRRCVFVDACDDWPDDWAAFVSASKLEPTHIFLTHCHVDNIINLNAFLHIFEQHQQRRLGLMFCPGEQCWVDAFPRACLRYERREEAAEPLPLFQQNAYSFLTYAHDLHRRERELREQAQPGTANPSAPPHLIRRDDVMLSSATNRSTSFHEMGPHCLLHYVFTPGHSPGHMMLSLPRERLLFTGDVLCYNKVGRVDLPWASGERLAESLLTLESYSDSTVILPGHGRLTTMGRERRHNLALRTLYERREIGQRGVSVGFNDGYL